MGVGLYPRNRVFSVEVLVRCIDLEVRCNLCVYTQAIHSTQDGKHVRDAGRSSSGSKYEYMLPNAPAKTAAKKCKIEISRSTTTAHRRGRLGRLELCSQRFLDGATPPDASNTRRACSGDCQWVGLGCVHHRPRARAPEKARHLLKAHACPWQGARALTSQDQASNTQRARCRRARHAYPSHP